MDNRIVSKHLNILFIKGQSFPNGYAMSKRHRYIVDYLNSENISSALIQTRTNIDLFDNPIFGNYGFAKYINANQFWRKGLFGKINYFIKILSFIYTHCNKSKSNVIIFPSILYIDLIPFYLFAKILGYDIIFDIVENYNTNGVENSKVLTISNFLSKKIYKKALGIFVISSQLKSYISVLAPQVPTCILPNSSPITSNNKKNFSDPIRILYSGTFAPKDGLEYLIKAYKEFCEKTKWNTELILTGGGNAKDVNSVLELAKNCRQIFYRGFVTEIELRQIIASSDILTMTRCNSEFANNGFPFKLSEYLASGNTVLATKVGDVPLYLKHKENAYLIEPENTYEIICALEYLIQNESESIEMGKKGQDVVRKKFDITVNGNIFVDFLVTCLVKQKAHENKYYR
jgi:glycosyltransferase involved in cell wall biosynthesis